MRLLSVRDVDSWQDPNNRQTGFVVVVHTRFVGVGVWFCLRLCAALSCCCWHVGMSFFVADDATNPELNHEQ